MKLIIKKRKLTAYETAFYFLWTIYIIAYFYLNHSEFAFMYDVAGLFNWISYFVAIALMMLFCVNRKLKIKQLILYLVLFAGMFLATVATHERYLMVGILFALIATKIDVEDFVKHNIVIMLFTFASIVIFSLIGILPNYTSEINGTYKQALGFAHPNTMAGVFFVILLQYIYLFVYRSRFTTLHLLIVGLGFAWVYKISASRSSAYSFAVIYVLVIISRIFPNLFKRNLFGIVLGILPVILTAVSFFFVNQFDNLNPFAVALNEILSSRLYAASVAVNKYGVSVFGQYLNTYGTRSLSHDSDAIFNIDMSYIRLPVIYGLFITVAILLGWFLFIRRTQKKGDIKLLLAATYFSLVGFGESSFILVPFNFALLFILQGLKESHSKD